MYRSACCLCTAVLLLSSLEEWVGDYEVDGWRLLGGTGRFRAPGWLQ